MLHRREKIFEDLRAAVAEQSPQRGMGGPRMGKTLSRRFDDEEAWHVARTYSVARNFPVSHRKRWLKSFRELQTPAENGDSFAWFVRGVRQLATQAACMKSENRSFRPLSGVSKLLWHRF